MTPQSEFARLRATIDQEIEAMRQGLNGYAIVSRHEVITHHFGNLGVLFENLSAQVGEQAAIKQISTQLENLLLDQCPTPHTEKGGQKEEGR
jgi:hypothetical protein